jgi:hypothetical protein
MRCLTPQQCLVWRRPNPPPTYEIRKRQLDSAGHTHTIHAWYVPTRRTMGAIRAASHLQQEGPGGGGARGNDLRG